MSKVPAPNLTELPPKQIEATSEFVAQHRQPDFYREEDGQLIHGGAVTIYAWADPSQTDLLVTTGDEQVVQARISPLGDVQVVRSE